MSYDETPEEAAERMALNGRVQVTDFAAEAEETRIHLQEKAKAVGMARAAANSATFDDQKDAIRYDVALARETGRTVTADTARAVLEEQGFVVDNANSWGAAFNAVAKEGNMRAVGVDKSQRDGRNRSKITEWAPC